jgi:catechol 2,3-dioxygenase-like lactoylglutathione lyase family enzyme
MPAPLEIKSLNHVAREAINLEESKRFYREILGFQDVVRPPFDFPGAWLYNYGMMIHLVENPMFSPDDDINTRGAHVAFHVDDIDAAEANLRQRGVTYKKSSVPGRNITQLFFQDPSGYLVEIGCYPATPTLMS